MKKYLLQFACRIFLVFGKFSKKKPNNQIKLFIKHIDVLVEWLKTQYHINKLS